MGGDKCFRQNNDLGLSTANLGKWFRQNKDLGSKMAFFRGLARCFATGWRQRGGGVNRGYNVESVFSRHKIRIKYKYLRVPQTKCTVSTLTPCRGFGGYVVVCLYDNYLPLTSQVEKGERADAQEKTKKPPRQNSDQQPTARMPLKCVRKAATRFKAGRGYHHLSQPFKTRQRLPDALEHFGKPNPRVAPRLAKTPRFSYHRAMLPNPRV